MIYKKYFSLSPTLLIFSFLFGIAVAQAKPAIDILIFSPHPDDETLACAGTILKAVQENKKVKIVFLTNGDAYTEAVALWLKKKPEELKAEDYIALGEERQKEALSATEKLGLKDEDVFFLSYPDMAIFPLWEGSYKSQPTKRTISPYKRTYKRAREGYSRQNLISDIKDILKEYKPKKIYTPHPLDTHKDHQATTHFVNFALEDLRKEDDNKWFDFIAVSYYLIHSPSTNPALKESFLFFQKPPRRENIIAFKYQKERAVAEYLSQLALEREKDFLTSFIKDNELFWDVPLDKAAYLENLEQEWAEIARYMRDSGYNVNFAPVVDVADNIENMSHPLVKKQRMYSEDPQVVTELASAVISGMLKGRIIPVVKHFPGLGSVYSDTHLMLPKADVSDTRLYKKDLFPFSEIIKKYPESWIMVDHAIYPDLSDKPASLSYEIQTKLLREKLGFKGIIVVDELLKMQAIEKYAFEQGIKEPFIGKIVVMAFQAGTDIAIIYPSQANTKEVISCIIRAVKSVVKKGGIKKKDIAESVRRILKEKEKIFGAPLERLLKKMTLEEKICQKLIVESRDSAIFKEYNLGGGYFHDRYLIAQAQKNSKIPMFIAGQHEGGIVRQSGINTRSAYVVGKEFERIAAKPKRGKPLSDVRVLCLAAHPDDEDAEALAYFGKKFNCRTYILLATPGEGGENKIKPSSSVELGVLRSEEIERAAAILGVKKVYYLDKKDFGYSLNLNEVFKKWDREETLEKLVYFFRLIRPHIIITKHNNSNTNDHAQHRALAVLAEEAFDLAGKPNAYPKRIKEGPLPWQPLKFYQRPVRTQSLSDEIVIYPQEYIASENKTIRQIACQALSEHRSQGDWKWLEANNPGKIAYKLVKSKIILEKETSFFDGIKTGADN